MSVGDDYGDYVFNSLLNYRQDQREYVIAVGTFIKRYNNGILSSIDINKINSVVERIPGHSSVSLEEKLNIIKTFTSLDVNYLNLILNTCEILNERVGSAPVAGRQVKSIGYTATDDCNMRKREAALKFIEQHSVQKQLYTGNYNYEDCYNNTQRDDAFDTARRRNVAEYAKASGTLR